MKRNSAIWLPLLMLLAFAVTRWPGLMGPDWANFSAGYAVAFCAGVYFAGRFRWIAPLAIFLAADVFLNFYYGAPILEVGIWLFILAKLGAFAALIWLGTLFRPKSSFVSLLSGGLLGAILFYLITNVASWLYDPAYPKTLSGLFQALTVGVPGLPPTWMFFKNTLLSGGLFTGLFCGSMKLSPATEAEKEQEEAAGESEVQPEESAA